MRWAGALLLLAAVTARAEEASRLEITTQNKMGQTLELKELTYRIDGKQVLNVGAGDRQLKDERCGALEQQLAPGSHTLAATLAYQGRRMGVFSYMTGYRFMIDVSIEVRVDPARKTRATLVAYLKTGLINFEERPTAGFYVSYDPPLVPEQAQAPEAPPTPLDAAVAAPTTIPKPPEPPPAPPSDAVEQVHTQLFNPSGITSHVVHFDFASEQPRPRFLRTLDRIARSLVGHPEIRRLRIEGHTDDIGDESYNQGLSERRALWVVNYLVGKKVAAERVHSIGLGESRPLVKRTSRVARARNRRIEFVIEE